MLTEEQKNEFNSWPTSVTPAQRGLLEEFFDGVVFERNSAGRYVGSYEVDPEDRALLGIVPMIIGNTVAPAAKLFIQPGAIVLEGNKLSIDLELLMPVAQHLGYQPNEQFMLAYNTIDVSALPGAQEEHRLVIRQGRKDHPRIADQSYDKEKGI